jgi:hypothetical protein
MKRGEQVRLKREFHSVAAVHWQVSSSYSYSDMITLSNIDMLLHAHLTGKKYFGSPQCVRLTSRSSLLDSPRTSCPSRLFAAFEASLVLMTTSHPQRARAPLVKSVNLEKV